jgi:hypothetical protein
MNQILYSPMWYLLAYGKKFNFIIKRNERKRDDDNNVNNNDKSKNDYN